MIKLFGLQGRISRGTFWVFKLAVAIVIAAIVAAVMKVGHAQPGDRHGFDHAFGALSPLAQGATAVASAIALWIFFAAHVKRLHDLDLSGWRMFSFTYWRCMFEDGTVGPNRYGPDPLVRTSPRAP